MTTNLNYQSSGWNTTVRNLSPIKILSGAVNGILINLIKYSHVMKTRILILLGVATISFATHAQINIVNNGGFEQGWLDGWGYTYGWGVSLGDSDAAEGRNYGYVIGTIFQDLATTPGQQYRLRFALSGNFNISSPSVVNVLWGGDSIGTASWNPSGHHMGNPGWVWSDFDVTATLSTTRLTFANPYVGDGSGRSGKLDAISVVAVPEPASVLLLAVGSFVLLKRQRRENAVS